MNFSSASDKLKSKPQNEDFYFDTETPRGHFFAVLDFAPHDYANLNATLKGKLETIVSSFVSLPSFSADLFLGFLAKEINNFLQNLGEQSGGPELLSSAAFCLLSGNRLSYFLSGEVKINVLSGVGLMPLNGEKPDASAQPGEEAESVEEADARSEPLGALKLEAPLTHQVHSFTLQDDHVVLIMTPALEDALGRRGVPKKLMNLRSSDPKLICDTLMKAGGSSSDERTLVVISGPYERYIDPVLEDLSEAVANLEARFNVLTESDTRRDSIVTRLEQQALNSDTELEQRLSQQIEMLKEDLRGKADKDLSGETKLEERLSRQIELLKEDLRGKADKDQDGDTKLEEKLGQQIELLKADLGGKAATIDLLELTETIKNLSVVLANKADTAEVLELQRDVLKLGIVSKERKAIGPAKTDADSKASASAGSIKPGGTLQSPPIANDKEPVAPDSLAAYLRSPFAVRAGLLILAIALVGAFIGGWLQSRVGSRTREAWSVKTSGNQILISRLDGGNQGSVNLTVAQPLKSTGEQKFSSFADVRQYIDTITGPQDSSVTTNQNASPTESQLPAGLTEITLKRGDSLQQLAKLYNTTPEKIMELNPTITEKTRLRNGQKMVVPFASPANAQASPQVEQVASPTPAANTREVRITASDTLDKLARRYNTTADRLKELNPQISNWRVLQIGQKVLVPAMPGG